MTEYESAIDEVKTAATTFEGRKKELILKCKDILVKNNHPTDSISTKICDDLKGYIDSSYIRKLLGDEFKNKARQRERPVMLTDGSTVSEQVTDNTQSSGLGGDGSTSVINDTDDFPEENKYYKGAKMASKSMQKQIAKEKEFEESESEKRASGGYSVQQVEYSLELDEDILDQIRILTQQNGCKKVYLKVDSRTHEVNTVQAIP